MKPNKPIPLSVETNRMKLVDAIQEQAKQEISLYEAFYQRVLKNAETHRQVSLNHIAEIGSRLAQLKVDADELRHRILYHNEEVVVNRQQIIASTETKVHHENQEILSFDHTRLPETLHSIDYLSQALRLSKVEFVDMYSRLQSMGILNHESVFEYFHDKSARVEMILSKYNQEVYDAFQELDHKVSSMDQVLTDLLKEKTDKIQRTNQVFESELRHYLDNQLTFSAEEDPTSVTIQALSSDKWNQFYAFQTHENDKYLQLKERWEDEYRLLREQLIHDYLYEATVQLNVDKDIFNHVEQKTAEYEALLPTLNPKTDSKRIAQVHRHLYALQKYPSLLASAQKQAKKRLSKQHQRRKGLIQTAAFFTLEQIYELNKNVNEYQALMSVDPFLAQTIGDQSSIMIKDYRTTIELLRVNSELKTNIEYDIQMAKLKHEINQLEVQQMFFVKETLLKQERDLLLELLNIHPYLLNRSKELFVEKKQLAKERYRQECLEQTARFHLETLLEQNAIHRQHLVSLTELMIHHIRLSESHEIYVGDAKGELDYLLKQYDMKALYFKTLYENELSYLVSQKTRTEEGQKTHYDFVLTTFLNQMRFAEEQIKLANLEFRSRLESFLHVLDEQKIYQQSQIDQLTHAYESKMKRLDEEYQASVYASSHLLNEVSDKKQRLALQKTATQSKNEYESKKLVIEKAYREHPLLVEAEEHHSRFDVQTAKAMEEAERLRDYTISVYSEMYHKAKDRYDTLKPYVDQNINVLDSVFFDHLELIKQNYRRALSEAELELEQLVEPHMQKFLQVYFSDQDQPRKLDYQDLVVRFQSQKQEHEILYQTRIKEMDAQRLAKEKELDQNYQLQLQQIDQLLPVIDQRQNALTVEYDKALKSLHKEQVESQNRKASEAIQTIKTLTTEYERALKNHQKMAVSMKQDFAKVVKSYEPYIRLQRKHTNFEQVLKQVRKEQKHLYRLERQAIHTHFKKYTIPNDKKLS